MDEVKESSINFIPCLAWVKRGACKSVPDKVKLSADELAEIIKCTQGDIDELEEAQEENGAIEDRTLDDGMDNDDADIEAKYNMDDYDNEEEMISDFGTLTVYARNQDDPILKAAKENIKDSEVWSDASSDENDEDFVLKATDNLILVGHVEEDAAMLEVYVYNAEEEALYVHHEILLPGAPICIEWLDYDPSASSPGNLAAIGTISPVIDIWDLDIVGCLEPALSLGKKAKKKKKIPGYGHKDAILSLSWNKNARNILASGSADKSAIVWDLEKGEVLQSVSVFEDDVQSLQFHPFEMQRLLTGSSDKFVREFDSRQPDLVKSWKVDSDVERVQYDHFNPNWYLVSTDSGMVYYFDTRTDKQLWQLRAHTQPCTALSLSTQVPGLLLTGSIDNSVKIWDIAANAPKMIFEKSVKIGSVYTIGCCPDVPWAFAFGGDRKDCSFKVWDCRESDKGGFYLETVSARSQDIRIRSYEETLSKYFIPQRHPISSTDNWLNARKGIVESFTSSIKDVKGAKMLQMQFQTEVADPEQPIIQRSVIGENIIAIFEGRYWKTAEDKILVFGANYDTPAIAQGLTDNGSGATGLLELAKELSEMLKNGGSLLYTVILVAFDVQKMKHGTVASDGETGSYHFVNDFLGPMLHPSSGPAPQFRGAIILDSIMNYHTQPNTQLLASGFDKVFPEANEFIKKNSNTGNYLCAVSKQTPASRFAGIAEDLNRIWSKAVNVDKYPLLDLEVVRVFGEQALVEFLKQDHMPFWNFYHNGVPSPLPAVLLSDTGIWRNIPKCSTPSCPELITIERLQFLDQTVTATSLLIADLQLDPSSVTDSVSSVFSNISVLVISLALGLMFF
ncbi:uncharacterized protein LOC136025116 isoform X2 [Artemia franciscana]|uniref:Peptidase M28 domain-containing protein n=1 Tax=Artemia franciscana TaxID=6661 RepID=A0AA88L4Y9_ARTSF|nr:hypothetical protein QYM36_011578 [Artemia franciscana]